MEKKIMTLAEATSYTGYSRRHMLKLISEGTIPASRPNGKSVFFEREKLEAWLLSTPAKKGGSK
ncbi:MAG: excisionase family DNA-binding protein [Niabella sp.]|nr:excisionase family DNA-binding protein [Niabella sp.]